MGAADLPRRPLVDKFLYRALVLVNAYQCAKFELPSSISFRDKEGVPKCNVGLLASCRTPYAETLCIIFMIQQYICIFSLFWRIKLLACLLCVLQVLGKIKQPAEFQRRISMQCIMQLCKYVLPIGFPLYVPKWEF